MAEPEIKKLKLHITNQKLDDILDDMAPISIPGAPHTILRARLLTKSVEPYVYISDSSQIVFSDGDADWVLALVKVPKV